MICIPAFMKFCSSRNLTSGRNNDGRNGKLEGLPAISYAVPIQNGWPTDPFTTEIMAPRCVLLMFAIQRFMVATSLSSPFFARPLPINSPAVDGQAGITSKVAFHVRHCFRMIHARAMRAYFFAL